MLLVPDFCIPVNQSHAPSRPFVFQTTPSLGLHSFGLIINAAYTNMVRRCWVDSPSSGIYCIRASLFFFLSVFFARASLFLVYQRYGIGAAAVWTFCLMSLTVLLWFGWMISYFMMTGYRFEKGLMLVGGKLSFCFFLLFLFARFQLVSISLYRCRSILCLLMQSVCVLLWLEPAVSLETGIPMQLFRTVFFFWFVLNSFSRRLWGCRRPRPCEITCLLTWDLGTLVPTLLAITTILAVNVNVSLCRRLPPRRVSMTIGYFRGACSCRTGRRYAGAAWDIQVVIWLLDMWFQVGWQGWQGS